MESDSLSVPGPLVHSSSSNSLRSVTRRPLTGQIKITLLSAENLPGKKSHKTDTYVVIRIDGVQKGKTKPARSKWNETIEIPIEKASEMELAVYDKSGSILALQWFKLWELEDELRTRVRMLRDAAQAEVASLSDALGSPRSHHVKSSSYNGNDMSTSRSGEPAHLPAAAAAAAAAADGIESWLELEPSGELQVRLDYTANVKRKKRVSYIS